MTEKEDKAEREVASYLKGFFDLIGEEPGLQVESKSPGELYVNVQGESDFFSEEREKLAKSLSVLVRVLLERQYDLDRDVQIDVNGVKLSRRKNLEQFALEAAERAKLKGRKIRLNPMPPIERKWIHVALTDTEGVETYSVGEGGDRRVIIKPKEE
ncbi:MAG: protein jag [Candidatus Bipolaricaulia bacterium]